MEVMMISIHRFIFMWTKAAPHGAEKIKISVKPFSGKRNVIFVK